MTDTINNKIPFVPENTIDPAAGLNLSLNTIDALLQVLVQTVGANTPPAGIEGQRHIVGTAPTGLWAGQANKLARFLGGAWQFFDARHVLNAADGLWYVRQSSTWSALAGSAPAWGSITGTLSAQTDLQSALDSKQATLVSATNIKTINGASVLGPGNLTVSGSGAAWGGITGTLADQTDLQAALTARALVAGLPSRTVTASGDVTPADAGKWLICTSATPITLTIGAEATAAWTTSGILPMFHVLQVGAGAVTVTGAGFSVTLHASDTNVLAGAGAAATAVWRAANTWSLIGRLVAA